MRTFCCTVLFAILSVDGPLQGAENRARLLGHVTVAAEFARFDLSTSQVVFDQNVSVKTPTFSLDCQTLITQVDSETANALDPKALAAQGQFQTATAKGFVVVRKPLPNGKIQIGKARSGFFDQKSKKVILTDYPILQDGDTRITATDPKTTIQLDEDGTYQVHGMADYESVPDPETVRNPK